IIWEDLLFNLYYLQYSTSAISCKESLYNYRIHPQSVMANSDKHISKEYNLLYDSFTTFCNANRFYSQESVFKKERAETCIGNLIDLIQPTSPGTGFWNFYRRFRKEISALNSYIYLYKSESGFALPRFERFLLKNKFFEI